MEQPPPTTYLVNGAAIRTRRKDLGMDLAECAATAHISRAYLNQLELGLRRHMKPPTYHRLRTALRIEPPDRRLLAPNEDPHRKE
ncbi:helix-turn-helix domain-containing protein [Streptomyces formicae]|uniref:Helix-turn-helix domain-containing protein n=1 Tax=Streptomyces formicae TaxID=1616117 RepID=A0ABY3WMJ9_9ACTN|nr:helix-turn-helix transcriptional regulator [Streptomyces formicae]UNM13831.1 helix-turn-helix domain-containing protein [Streptomyces formicae]